MKSEEFLAFSLSLFAISYSLLPLCHLLCLSSRMTFEGSGRREFTKLVADHILRNKDGNVTLAIVYAEGQSDHFRRYRRASRPGLDCRRFVAGRRDLRECLLNAKVDERTLF